MKQFQIKNLLIQILPDDKQLLNQLNADCTAACSLNITNYTKDCCAGGCSHVPSGACFPCSELPTKLQILSADAASLPLLKAQLKLALQEVEIREQLAAEQLRVQNGEDAAVLEKELTSALKEVKSLKDRFGSEKGKSLK